MLCPWLYCHSYINDKEIEFHFYSINFRKFIRKKKKRLSPEVCVRVGFSLSFVQLLMCNC